MGTVLAYPKDFSPNSVVSSNNKEKKKSLEIKLDFLSFQCFFMVILYMSPHPSETYHYFHSGFIHSEALSLHEFSLERWKNLPDASLLHPSPLQVHPHANISPLSPLLGGPVGCRVGGREHRKQKKKKKKFEVVMKQGFS